MHLHNPDALECDDGEVERGQHTTYLMLLAFGEYHS